MNKELKEKLDEFISDFLSVSEVKQYLLIKKEIESSKEIALLREKLKKAQKDMALSMGDVSYKEKKDIYYKAKREYEDHPLVVNYLSLQDEVYSLLKELEINLKE